VLSTRFSAALSLLLVLAACGRDKAGAEPSPAPSVAEAPPEPSAPPPAPEPPEAPPRPLNVFLLMIDSMRADMPWAGYERPIAPFLTELAGKSAVYTNHYSVSSYTAKSVATVLTGRYPSTHFRSGFFFTDYYDSNLFFSELLQKAGIRTIAWHSHLYYSRGKGLNQGFDVWELVPGLTFNPNTDEEVTSPRMTKLGLELLGNAENTSKQFFAWAHYMDPHDVYVQHKESPVWGRYNRDRYDSEIFFVDLWVKELLTWAKKQPWWENTALIVTGDHGEAFGEQGMYKHAFEVWEPLLRVPLFIMAPGIEPKRIDARRSHIDLAPTIMELMGQPVAPEFMGKSLVPELYGAEEPNKRDYVLSELTEDTHNPARRALIIGDYKLIVFDAGHRSMLFNLADDPKEQNDLAKSQPDKLTEMRAELDRIYASMPVVDAHGGMKLKSGRTARGPRAPIAPKGDAGTQQ
jgi:arylsulfatase A-like enzyme